MFESLVPRASSFAGDIDDQIGERLLIIARRDGPLHLHYSLADPLIVLIEWEYGRYQRYETHEEAIQVECAKRPERDDDGVRADQKPHH